MIKILRYGEYSKIFDFVSMILLVQIYENIEVKHEIIGQNYNSNDRSYSIILRYLIMKGRYSLVRLG